MTDNWFDSPEMQAAALEGWMANPVRPMVEELRADGYRHEIGYLADQLRQYVDRTVTHLAATMNASDAAKTPALAERLSGYNDAVADIQAMLRNPTHRFHLGLVRYVAAARETL